MNDYDPEKNDCIIVPEGTVRITGLLPLGTIITSDGANAIFRQFMCSGRVTGKHAAHIALEYILSDEL